MARRWFAPAKLNLYLHVVGRRFDGFHLLDSLVAFAEIGDEISAESAPSLSLTVDGPYAAGLSDAPRDNLVWRAAELLAAHAGRPAAAALTLTKNLPIASGIGGGSSDAAAVLKALNTVWRLGLAEAELARLGAALGADVPVCVGTRAAWLGGIGDEVAPSALPTPAVFKARQGPFSAAARFDAMPADAAGLAALLAARRNDLTNAAVGLVPVIGEVLDRLATLEGALIARMSGSGATCFALFAEAGAAATAGARLRVERPNWWVAAGSLF
jgi:4-diphosphocytidyl-2-C-methyl-D-erythritol kinase